MGHRGKLSAATGAAFAAVVVAWAPPAHAGDAAAPAADPEPVDCRGAEASGAGSVGRRVDAGGGGAGARAMARSTAVAAGDGGVRVAVTACAGRGRASATARGEAVTPR